MDEEPSCIHSVSVFVIINIQLLNELNVFRYGFSTCRFQLIYCICLQGLFLSCQCLSTIFTISFLVCFHFRSVSCFVLWVGFPRVLFRFTRCSSLADPHAVFTP